MAWLSRLGGGISEKGGAGANGAPAPAPVERAAPGLAAFFDGVPEDGAHAVLDFGAAAEGTFRLYSRFARHIRFVDLLTDSPQGEAWDSALEALPQSPENPYDLVLAWNLLDWLSPAERILLVKRLTKLTAPGTRLYVVVDQSGSTTTHPLRFSIVDFGRVRQEPAGPLRPTQPQLLPAQVERLLEPFRVVHAYTLRHGLREYVAVRR